MHKQKPIVNFHQDSLFHLLFVYWKCKFKMFQTRGKHHVGIRSRLAPTGFISITPFPCFYVESLKVSVVEWSQEIGSRCFRHFKIPCPNPLRIPSHLLESKLKSPLSLMALQTPLWETPSWEGWVWCLAPACEVAYNTLHGSLGCLFLFH